jgi:hypothetical protein
MKQDGIPDWPYLILPGPETELGAWSQPVNLFSECLEL